MRGDSLEPRMEALLPGKRDGTHCTYRSLDGPQGLYEWVRNISSPPGFEHRTVQPLPSHYTDYVNPAHY